MLSTSTNSEHRSLVTAQNISILLNGFLLLGFLLNDTSFENILESEREFGYQHMSVYAHVVLSKVKKYLSKYFALNNNKKSTSFLSALITLKLENQQLEGNVQNRKLELQKPSIAHTHTITTAIAVDVLVFHLTILKHFHSVVGRLKLTHHLVVGQFEQRTARTMDED
uniref:Uncharacterized protein n=1 Tax=Glossina brevipalpis TaxID=37001 RepID=A0A1A9WU43_9MUSC